MGKAKPKPEYSIGDSFVAKEPIPSHMPNRNDRLTIIGNVTKLLYKVKTDKGEETKAHRDWLHSFWNKD